MIKYEDSMRVISGFRDIENASIVNLNKQEFEFKRKFEAIESDPIQKSKFWASLYVISQYVLEVLKDYTDHTTGQVKSIKWYDFILKKSLRRLVYSVIALIIDLFKGSN